MDGPTATPRVDQELSTHLRRLRAERGWSLDDLATRSGVSRATLSRLENASVSPTTAVLAKLCTAFGLTLSRLLFLAESTGSQRISRARQPVWHDPETGFTRRGVSPPAAGFCAEVLECTLEPGARIAYPEPPLPDLEHHLVLLGGALRVQLDETVHDLAPDDSLRYRLAGSSSFESRGTDAARYLLVIL